MHNFRELIIWQKSMELAKEVLMESKSFDVEHKFGITSQIIRSAVSIPSNIAEGSARTTDKEFSRFLDIAQGSSYELETQLILGTELTLLSEDKFNHILKQLNELQRMIRGFQKSLI